MVWMYQVDIHLDSAHIFCNISILFKMSHVCSKRTMYNLNIPRTFWQCTYILNNTSCKGHQNKRSKMG